MIGGVLIGLSAIILMGGIGRIAGISGIIGGVFSFHNPLDKLWRLSFIAGLLIIPFVLVLLWPSLKVIQFKTMGGWLIAAGVIVGIGTQLGNGCTSGHGVCGNARISERSIIATITFMTMGIVTVFVAKYLGLFL